MCIRDRAASAHVGAQPFAAGRVGAPGRRIDFHAVKRMRRFARGIALTDVVFDVFELAVERVAITAAAAGPQGVDVALSEKLCQHLAGREAGILAVALKLHLVTKPGTVSYT